MTDKPKLEFQPKPTSSFEIVLVNRNALGEPTGSTRTYKSDNAYDLSQFYLRHKGKPKNKKKKTTKKDEAAVAKNFRGTSKQAYVDSTERVAANGDN